MGCHTEAGSEPPNKNLLPMGDFYLFIYFETCIVEAGLELPILPLPSRALQ